MIVKLEIFPKKGWNKEYLKPPPSYNSYLEPKKAMKVLVNRWIYQGSLWWNQPKLHAILKWKSLKMTLHLHCLIPPKSVFNDLWTKQVTKHTIPRDFGQRTIAKELADTCPKASEKWDSFESQGLNVTNTFRCWKLHAGKSFLDLHKNANPRKYIEHILPNGGLMVMNPVVESVFKKNPSRLRS